MPGIPPGQVVVVLPLLASASSRTAASRTPPVQDATGEGQPLYVTTGDCGFR